MACCGESSSAVKVGWRGQLEFLSSRSSLIDIDFGFQFVKVIKMPAQAYNYAFYSCVSRVMFSCYFFLSCVSSTVYSVGWHSTVHKVNRPFCILDQALKRGASLMNS